MKYVLVALESEVPNIELPDDYTLMITGVGKVNAAIMATIAATQKNCEGIINYGTAGALNKDLVGDLHRVGVLRQRDMDARPQAELGITPFEESEFAGDIKVSEENVSISTGDNFVTDAPELGSDLVDMESYAIAKVAGMFGKPVVVLKYASDFADANAADDWQANVAKGKDLFVEWLENNK